MIKAISGQQLAFSRWIMRNFRELKVWEKSHQLTLDIYNITKEFPKPEFYGLVSQIRRSSSSIPTNIAEGSGQNTDGQFARFLQISLGSASELEYQLLLAYDLEYLDENTYVKLNDQTTEVKRMLTAFLQKLNADR
jgi:four helix bundle protein